MQLRPVLAEGEHLAATTSWEAVLLHPARFKPTPSALFHNNGDGTFTLVSTAPTSKGSRQGLGVVATDINDDGLMDLFVANDTVQNFLFA